MRHRLSNKRKLYIYLFTYGREIRYFVYKCANTKNNKEFETPFKNVDAAIDFTARLK